MAYAIRNDGKGWRAVNGPEDVAADETFSETEPTLASSVVASMMWEKIKTERDRRSEAGCQVAGNWFHNDLKSRTQWERMANRSVGLADADPYLVDGNQVAWKTMSGAFVPLTAGLIRQVVDAFEVQEVATFKAAEIHRAAMVAAADPSAYDYSGDWPAIFEPSQP